MQKRNDAETALDDWQRAIDLVSRAATLICTKAEMIGPLHLLTIVVCGLGYAFGDWFRWAEGFFICVSLVSLWHMRALLVSVRQAHRVLGQTDYVLGNHIRLNLLSALLFTYALVAVYRDWPVPIVAVVFGSYMNYVHYRGYQPSASPGE